MKKMSMVAAGLMLMTGMASADVIATYDFGNFSAGVISPLDDVTVSLGVAPDYSDLSDPATAFLFDDVLPKTGPSSYTFIINSTNDGNWLISTTRLANGANRNLSPYVVYGSSGITTYLTTTEFDDGYDPFVFPSTVDLSTTPITSIEMDITDVSFYQQNVFDTDFYFASMNISVTFYSGSSTSVPTPAALSGGATLLAALTLTRRRRIQPVIDTSRID